MQVLFKKITQEAITPTRATNGAAGYDIYCIKDQSIEPGCSNIFKTGLIIALPEHPDPYKKYEIQIRPRSGLSLKHITVPNSPGTIDEDYRGEIGVILNNSGSTIFDFKKGDRIAQILFKEVFIPELVETMIVNDTERGDGGFGHTG